MRSPLLVACVVGCGPSVGAEGGSTSFDTTSAADTRPLPTDVGPTPDVDVDVGPESDPGGDDVRYDIGKPGDLVVCGDSVEVEALPSEIELLVDASQTMVDTVIDHDGDPVTPAISRWALLVTALQEHLPTWTERSRLGLQPFPRFDAGAPPALDACAIAIGPVEPGATADELLAELPPADSTFFLGATPFSTAYAVVHSELTSRDPGPPRAIVLFTDGAPNCDEGTDPPALFDEVDPSAQGWVALASQQGIPTHVVALAVPTGISGGGPEGDAVADHHAALQALAAAADTPFADVVDAATLDIALEAIVQSTTSCRLRVPADFLGVWISVAIGPAIYEEIAPVDCDTFDGFFPVDDAEDVLQMCGAGCDDLRASGTAVIVENCVFPE